MQSPDIIKNAGHFILNVCDIIHHARINVIPAETKQDLKLLKKENKVTDLNFNKCIHLKMFQNLALSSLVKSMV